MPSSVVGLGYRKGTGMYAFDAIYWLMVLSGCVAQVTKRRRVAKVAAALGLVLMVPTIVRFFQLWEIVQQDAPGAAVAPLRMMVYAVGVAYCAIMAFTISTGQRRIGV
jgi:hypothetical protein